MRGYWPPIFFPGQLLAPSNGIAAHLQCPDTRMHGRSRFHWVEKINRTLLG